MNVAYLNPNGTMGGAEVALLSILAAIKSAEPDWQLSLVVAGDGPLIAKARALGVNTEVLLFPPSLARIGDSSAGGPAGKQTGGLRTFGRLILAGPGIASYIFKLRRTIRRLDPDIIHSNGFKLHILGALAASSPSALIWHVHDYVSSRPFMARLIKMFQSRCSLMLANSESVKRDIESMCGGQVKVQTVYNAIDTSEFSPEGPHMDLDELSGLKVNAGSDEPLVRVGLLATFARWKGHEVFLRALSLIPPDVPLRAYIIGGALYQTNGSQYSIEELKTLARELGVSDRVGFTGFVEQPAAAMRALDIVVHSSTEPEPFGLVIVEGMACGRAVILSEAGGAAELLQKKSHMNSQASGDTQRSALAYQPGDARALAERITELAADPHLRARLGAAGRATAEQHFKRDRLAAELIPIYRSVAKPA